MAEREDSAVVEFLKGCVLLSVLGLSSFGAWEYIKTFEGWLVSEWNTSEPLMLATSLTLLGVFRQALGRLHFRASNYLLGFRFIVGCPLFHHFLWLLRASGDDKSPTLAANGWAVAGPVCLSVVLFEETIVANLFPPFVLYLFWLYCGQFIKRTLTEPFEVLLLAVEGERIAHRIVSMPILMFLLLLVVVLRFEGFGRAMRFVRRCWEDRIDLRRIILERHQLLDRARKNPFYAKLHKDPKQFLHSLAPTSTNAVSFLTEEGNTRMVEGLQTILERRLRESSRTSTKRDSLYESLVAVHGPVDSFERILLPCRVNLQKDKSVFRQVVTQLKKYSLRRLKNGLNVTFEGEYGVDGGGLTASLFTRIAEELVKDARVGTASLLRQFDDNTFMLAASDREDIEYYNLGQIVGLAILHGHVFPMPLCSAMLKIIVDEEIDWFDVQAVDPLYFRNRMLILLESGGVEIVREVLELEDIPFVWLDEEGELGDELCPGGCDLTVDEENKFKYLQLTSEFYLCNQVRKEISLFLAGVYELVPGHLFKTCKIDFVELSLILSK